MYCEICINFVYVRGEVLHSRESVGERKTPEPLIAVILLLNA